MKKKLLYFISVVAVLLVFVLLINSDWFDEELLPEVQAIKDIHAEPYRPGNGYIGILAFSSGPGYSFDEASERIRQFLNNKIKQTGLDYLTGNEYNELIGSRHDGGWMQDRPNCNGRKQLGCTKAYVSYIEDLDWNDARLSEQYLRYLEFIDSNHYKEPHFIDWSGSIAYGPTLDMSKIYLAKASSPDNKNFLNEVGKDAQFWQIMFDQSNYLISQMVAIAALHHHIHTYSYAINNDHLNEAQLRTLQDKIKPPPENAMAMQNIFKYEFKYGMAMFDQIEAEKTWYQRIDFFQPQATHNLNYQVMFPILQDLIKLDARNYVKRKKQFMNPELKSPSIWSFDMLYNPTGKLYSEYAYAIPAYIDYISRYHDLNAKWLLLKAQIDIALHPEQPIEQTLTESNFQNPITGQPFDYNPKDGTIGFDCMDRLESNCRLQIH